MATSRFSASAFSDEDWTLRFQAPQAMWSLFAFADEASDAAYPTAWASSHLPFANFLTGAFLPRCNATAPVAA
jgi:hypothetical protein